MLVSNSGGLIGHTGDGDADGDGDGGGDGGDGGGDGGDGGGGWVVCGVFAFGSVAGSRGNVTIAVVLSMRPS